MAISWKNTSVSLDIPVWPATWQPEWALQQVQNNQPIVALNSDVTPQILAHLSQAHTERGGLLLGRIWRSELHSTALVGLVEICQPVPAPAADSSALSLTMDASVWEASRLICAQSPTPLRVVGWYHSHPNLTAFFSHTDRQTQAAFFSNAFSVGWVIDPFNTDRDGSLNEAFFIGPQSLPINVFRMP